MLTRDVFHRSQMARKHQRHLIVIRQKLLRDEVEVGHTTSRRLSRQRPSVGAAGVHQVQLGDHGGGDLY